MAKYKGDVKLTNPLEMLRNLKYLFIGQLNHGKKDLRYD
jgi:hypothetical protein